MSKLLAVLISFTFVFTGFMVHAASPVHSANEADFSKSYAIHSCHSGGQISKIVVNEDIDDKKMLSNESHHCVLDFVIVSPLDSNCEKSKVLLEIAFLQRQLSPTSPERLGKPPKV